MAESYTKPAREKQGALIFDFNLPTKHSPSPPRAGDFIAKF
jgi:hypothetical protein